MDSDTTTTSGAATETTQPSPGWFGAIVAGLIAGVAYGAIYWFLKPKILKVMIPMLIGLKGAGIGWAIHMTIAAVWALVFAAIAVALGWTDSPGRSVALGLTFAAAVWLLDTVVLLPLWMHGVIGFPKAPAFPNWEWPSLGVHLVYGFIVGICYPYLDDW